MKYGKQLSVFAAMLVIGAVAHAQNSANPSLLNPFGKAAPGEKKAAASMRKSEALAALPSKAAAKINRKFLDTVLDQEENTFIVEYVSAPPEKAVSAREHEVKLRGKKSGYGNTKRNVAASFNTDEYENLREYPALPMNYVRIKNRNALVKLLNNPDVKAVHENKPHQLATVQSLPFISQPEAAGMGRGGKGTTVAVLDTGVDYTRGAFNHCTSPGTPSTCRVIAAFDTAPDDGTRDGHGHGTNVAAIIAAVAPDSNIAAIDVFRPDGAWTKDIIAGIDWVVENKSKYNIVAVNLSIVWAQKHIVECSNSWATTPFANARAAGVLPVLAAGNNSFTDGVTEPACAPGAVRVGAVYDSNMGQYNNSFCTDPITAADRVACFSNGGELLTLFAPGADIFAGGIVMAGTSQAAPHVAGAVAVLRAADAAPDDTLDQTIQRMLGTGKIITDHRNGISKPRLNLFAAAQSIAQVRVEPPGIPEPAQPDSSMKSMATILQLLMD
ncbi:MAG: S8 family serine peptidase [Pseudomonadota bacterium]